jgi:hypothetical protein
VARQTFNSSYDTITPEFGKQEVIRAANWLAIVSVGETSKIPIALIDGLEAIFVGTGLFQQPGYCNSKPQVSNCFVKQGARIGMLLPITHFHLHRPRN